jgi:hypothetical protein
MCFYEMFRFECGDWKWGNFKQHCNKEYRMGETCGMKLVLETFQQPTKCRLCEKYATKIRKRQAECDRIERWQRENKNPASIEKSYANIASLDEEIRLVYDEISARRSNINGTRPTAQDYHAGHY